MTKKYRKILGYSVAFSLVLQLVGAPLTGVFAATSNQIAEWFARENKATSSIEDLSPETEELQSKLDAIVKTKDNLKAVADEARASLEQKKGDLLGGRLEPASMFMLTEKAGGYANYIAKYGVYADVEMDTDQYDTWLNENKTKLENINQIIETNNQGINAERNTISNLTNQLFSETDESKRASLQNQIDSAKSQLKTKLKTLQNNEDERKLYLLSYSVPNHILHIKEVNAINDDIGVIVDGLTSNQIDDEWINAIETANIDTNISDFLENGVQISDLTDEETIRESLKDKEQDLFDFNKELKIVEREKLEDIFVFTDDEAISEQYKTASKTAIESLETIVELKDKHANIVQTKENLIEATGKALSSLADAKDTIMDKAPSFASLFMLENAGGFNEYIMAGVFDGVSINPDKYKELLSDNTTEYEAQNRKIKTIEQDIEKLQDKNGLTEQEQTTLADKQNELTNLKNGLEEQYGLNYAIPHDTMYVEVLDEMDEWSEYLVVYDINDSEWTDKVEQILGSTSKYDLSELFIDSDKKSKKLDINTLFESNIKKDDLDTEDTVALELDEAKTSVQNALNNISSGLSRQAVATLLPTFDVGGEILNELVDGFISIEITSSQSTLFTPVDTTNLSDSKTTITAKVTDIDGEPVIGARVSFNSGNSYFPDNSGGFSNTDSQLTVENEDKNQSGIVAVDYTVTDDEKVASQYKRDVVDVYAVATVELKDGTFSKPTFAHLEIVKENKNLVKRDPAADEQERAKDDEAEKKSDGLLLEARSNPGNLIVNMTAEINPQDNLEGDTEATVTVRVQAAFAKQATGIRDEKTGQPAYTDEKGHNVNFNAPQTLKPKLIFSGIASDEEDTAFSIQFPLHESANKWNITESEERDVDGKAGLVEKTVAWAINQKIKKKINLNTALPGVRDIDILVELTASSLGLDEEIKSIIREQEYSEYNTNKTFDKNGELIENREQVEYDDSGKPTTSSTNNTFVLDSETLIFRQDNPAPDQEVEISFEANPKKIDEGQVKVQLTGELTGTIWEIVRDPSNGMEIKQPGRTQKLSGTAKLSISSSDNETGFLDQDTIEIPESGKFKINYYTPEAKGERNLTISISGSAFDKDDKHVGDFATSLTIEHGIAAIDESIGDSRVLLGEDSDGNRTMKVYGSRADAVAIRFLQPYDIWTSSILDTSLERGDTITSLAYNSTPTPSGVLVNPKDNLNPWEFEDTLEEWEQSKPLFSGFDSTKQFNNEFEQWKNSEPKKQDYGLIDEYRYVIITTEISDIQSNIITDGSVRGQVTGNHSGNRNDAHLLAAEGARDEYFYKAGVSQAILEPTINHNTGETTFYYVPNGAKEGETGTLNFSHAYSGQGRLSRLSVDAEIPIVSAKDAVNSSKPTIKIITQSPKYVESGMSEMEKCEALFNPRNPVESNKEVAKCVENIRLKQLGKIRSNWDQTSEEAEYEQYSDQAWKLRINVTPGKNGASSSGQNVRITSEPPAVFIPAPGERPVPATDPFGNPLPSDGNGGTPPIQPEPLPADFQTQTEFQLTRPGEINLTLDSSGKLGADGKEVLILPNTLPTKITVHYGTYSDWKIIGGYTGGGSGVPKQEKPLANEAIGKDDAFKLTIATVEPKDVTKTLNEDNEKDVSPLINLDSDDPSIMLRVDIDILAEQANPGVGRDPIDTIPVFVTIISGTGDIQPGSDMDKSHYTKGDKSGITINMQYDGDTQYVALNSSNNKSIVVRASIGYSREIIEGFPFLRYGKSLKTESLTIKKTGEGIEEFDDNEDIRHESDLDLPSGLNVGESGEAELTIEMKRQPDSRDKYTMRSGTTTFIIGEDSNATFSNGSKTIDLEILPENSNSKSSATTTITAGDTDGRVYVRANYYLDWGQNKSDGTIQEDFNVRGGTDGEDEPDPDPEPEPEPEPTPEPEPGDKDSFEFNPDQPLSFDINQPVNDTNNVLNGSSYISDRDRERYNGYIESGDYDRAAGVIYGKVRSNIPDEFKSNPEVRELADSATNLKWSKELADVLNDSKFSESEKRYIEQALTQFLEDGNLAALDAIANVERYGIDDWPEQIRRDYKNMGFDIDIDSPTGGQFGPFAPDFYKTISDARQTVNGSTILDKGQKFTLNGTIGLDAMKQYPASTLSSTYHNMKSHIDSATADLDSTHTEVVALYQMLNNILLDNFLIETLEQSLNDSQKQSAATWVSQIKQGQVSAIDNFTSLGYWSQSSNAKKLDRIKSEIIYNRSRMGLDSGSSDDGDEVPLFGDLSGNLDNLFNIFIASANTDDAPVINPVVNIWNSVVNLLSKLFIRN